MSAYQSEQLEQHGVTYRIDRFYDCDMGAPWDEHDGHGVVSDWTTRDKRPSERVLNSDRHGKKRYYDIQATIKKATSEGWGCANLGTKLTPKQSIAEAVERDFKYLQDWCNDQWHWMGLEVTEIREDTDGFKYDGYSASLWGIESESDISSMVQDLIGEVEYQNNHKKAA